MLTKHNLIGIYMMTLKPKDEIFTSICFLMSITASLL